MNRAQRKAHVRVWPLLALALLVIIGAAITVRHRVSSVITATQEWAPRNGS